MGRHDSTILYISVQRGHAVTFRCSIGLKYSCDSNSQVRVRKLELGYAAKYSWAGLCFRSVAFECV